MWHAYQARQGRKPITRAAPAVISASACSSGPEAMRLAADRA
jgi:hypothetical protein